ncbi:MAG: hypothetical protein EXS17_06730 [Phycisphaerales bacterium]|nr:hypothetical protein [Phycisphaerales bacterium]
MRTIRALTIVDTLIALACGGILCALGASAAARLRPASGEAISMANEIEIGTAHALYSWDWGGLQWCTHKSDFGLTLGSCSTYLSTVSCPPQVILGSDAGGALWGYWLAGGLCPWSFPGSCGNWILYTPNEFTTTSGVFGGYRMMQARSFHDYLNGRFYDEVYYAPNDRRTYGAASRHFAGSAEFSSLPNPPVFSSYAMSPAAMWHPDVLRGASDGGFQSPSAFPDAFARQSLFNAAYPELKSLVFEVNWNQNPPASGQSLGSTVAPYRFNQGAASRPITLFYDGHVGFLPNKQAMADDAALIAQGADGLWSRDTPLGVNGYFADQSIDGSRTNHSILTTDGILGRDVLSAP